MNRAAIWSTILIATIASSFARVHGVVRARETGEPVAGATVYESDYSFYGVVRSWRLVTDEEGKYAIDDASPGYINLEAWAPDFRLAGGNPVPVAGSCCPGC